MPATFPPFHRLLLRRVFAGLLMAVTLLCLLACNFGRYGSYLLLGGDEEGRKVQVEAEYRGLDHRTVAVLVAADEFTLYQHPSAAQGIARAVSQQLVANVAGIKVSDPAQVAQFQRDNPYWNTLPYRDLMKRLNVERMVYVDIGEYATHEPGNPYVKRGIIDARVGVAEAEAADPNTLAYRTIARAVYPPGNPVGTLDADDATIEAAAIALFSLNVANRFRDYETVEKR